MWFINGKLQVIELKRRAQEKRARRVVTRPEPTIYGNCDSWSFIVGKKPGAYTPRHSSPGTLQHSNKKVINNLFTIGVNSFLDNLWAICGATVHQSSPSRMVVPGASDMLPGHGNSTGF
ncbi:hypothetical protein PY257_04055 [Ramlibacter sp. H39-3-26]|uniref:hypothetical protein n=1 Tax=Curvibacter soli TaxID=3031331 RepID=UPI0023DA802E|nr:hypothetical protein [Ramlibacter sp. H39-3-26]MDF1484360.1 hypothetical protein [Ramlibacter sp. H39-3-26]